ncbi:MAG: class I SAM-dependent methyltransferase [Verrucomicrobiota bacterium]|nr:class I SAM-dependent methyltransferase [Verrucomicrobiota bacterium]
MNISTQYLDGQYLDKNPTFHVEDSPWKAGQITRILKKNSLRPSSIAEIGCGAGEILVQLLPQFQQSSFFGYELSPQAYELCKKRANEKIHFFNSDLFEEPDKLFDLLLCIDVIEHIEDYFTFLRRLKQHGKAFVFHIPLDMNVQMVFRSAPIIGVRKAVGHLHYFSKDTALAALADCGYEVMDWFYTPHGTDRPKSAKAKLLNLPRRVLSFFNADLTARVLGGYSLLVYARPVSDP